MNQKNYAACLFLFFGLLNGSLSFGQAPIADNPTFQLFASECYSPSMSLVGYVTGTGGGIDWNSVDIDMTQPGIQTQFFVNTQGVFQVVNGSFYFTSFGFPAVFPIQNVALSYTIKDLSGNTSNVGSITFIINRLITYTSAILPTCDSPNSGSITVQGLGGIGSTRTINLHKTNDASFTASVQTSGIEAFYTFNNLPFGYYTYEITNDDCSVIAENNKPAASLFAPNPVNASGTGTYQDYNNDGIVNVGDVINYQFSVANSSTTCAMNDVAVSYSLTPTGGPIASLAAGASDTTTLTGYVPITQENINASLVHLGTNVSVSNPGINAQSFLVNDVPLNISDGIKLNAFIDTNNNNLQDNGEQNYTEGTFSYQINGFTTHNVVTSTGMYYLYETNPGNSYTLNYNINPNNSYCGAQYTVLNSSFTGVTVSSGSGIITYNFAITEVPCNDIAVDFAYSARPRPGFTYTNIIRIKNEGNQTLSAGTIAFTKDSAVTIASVSDAGYTPTTNGFTLNFYNLFPGESRNITIAMQIPVIPTVTIGQFLTNSVVVSPTDDYAANNSSTLVQPIVGSFDPNEKTESHGGKVLYSAFTADDYLTYTIRFENTGTAEAINIRVNDLLDAKLDETSVKMVAASHAYVLDRVGNNLNWRFDGINLPPAVANDEVTGHGYVTFKVKPKMGYALGDVIPNTANIYFDFNPAIVTEPCVTQFVNTLGTQSVAIQNFRFSPNPVKDKISISSDTTIDTLILTSALGQKVYEKNIAAKQSQVDLSNLPSGIYFMKVSAKGAEKTLKIIKE